MSTEEQRAIREVRARIVKRHSEAPEEEVDAVVDEVYAQFDGHPIRDFVPVLVERRALEDLRHRHEPPAI